MSSCRIKSDSPTPGLYVADSRRRSPLLHIIITWRQHNHAQWSQSTLPNCSNIGLMSVNYIRRLPNIKISLFELLYCAVYVGNGLYSVKLNGLDLLRFHRAGLYHEVWGRGSYITLFSPSDVTAFHRKKYRGRGCYITLFSPSDVTEFHRWHTPE